MDIITRLVVHEEHDPRCPCKPYLAMWGPAPYLVHFDPIGTWLQRYTGQPWFNDGYFIHLGNS